MKSKTSLFINVSLANVSTTPIYVMPLSVLSIMAYLRQSGDPVDFLDFNVLKRKNPALSDDQLITLFEDRIREMKPAMVGSSVMVAGQFNLAREISKSTKKILPESTTIVGGAHVSQFPGKILEQCPEIDFVAIGEGEQQALACARYAQTGSVPAEWPDGLAYRERGEVVVRPKNSYFRDMDALPYPAYDLVEFGDYLHDTSFWHNPHQVDLGVRVPLITSRGCPNFCNFCSVAKCMGLPYRPLSAQNVVDLIQRLHEEQGASYFAIFDANFTEDSDRVIKICDEIAKRNLRLILDMPTGLPINMTAKDMIDALAGVGLIRTCISVESGDAYIRNKVMKKNIRQEAIFKVVEAIRAHPQVFLLVDFVLGMPEDTVESVEASCRVIDHLDVDDIALSIATPYPGTKLFDQCVEHGLFFEGIDPNAFWMADWFSNANLRTFIIKPYKLDLNTLIDYRDRILSARDMKLAAYRRRMKTRFRIDSPYVKAPYMKV